MVIPEVEMRRRIIIRTIFNNLNEIDRLHALILLAEDWDIDEDEIHDADGTSLHSILTVLANHIFHSE